jgi:hypothetical protein
MTGGAGFTIASLRLLSATHGLRGAAAARDRRSINVDELDAAARRFLLPCAPAMVATGYLDSMGGGGGAPSERRGRLERRVHRGSSTNGVAT